MSIAAGPMNTVLEEILAALFGLAVDEGTSQREGGCGTGIALLFVCASVLACIVFLDYLDASSCETQCAEFGSPNTIAGECMCRTTEGEYIDPTSPPSAPE